MKNKTMDQYNILEEPIHEFLQWKAGKYIVPEEPGEEGFCIRGVVHAVKKRISVESWGEAEVTSEEFYKNNDVKHHGILIRSKGQIVIPTIYVEDCLAGLGYDDKMETLADRIICMYADGLKVAPRIKTELPPTEDGFENLLEVRLVDMKLNENRCRSLVMKPLEGGFAYILYMVITYDDYGTMGAAITEDMANELTGDDPDGISHLFDIALQNTMKKNKPVLADLEEVYRKQCRPHPGSKCDNLLCCLPEQGYYAAAGCVDIDPENLYMYVLTNEEGIMGASALFYPGIMDAIYSAFNMSFYVIPSSIHDVIIVPDNGDIDELAIALVFKTANDSVVDEKEILSNRMMKYSPDTGLVDCLNI